MRETIDWGRIVFLLVEEGKLNRQDSDTIDDFGDGFVFRGDDAHGEVRLPACRVLKVLADGVERDAGVRGVLVSLPQLIA